GRWRTRVRHPRTGKHLSARTVIGGPESYATREAAAVAENEARKILRSSARTGVTVREFWGDWTTDALWLRRRGRRTCTIGSEPRSWCGSTATFGCGRSATSTSQPG